MRDFSRLSVVILLISSSLLSATVRMSATVPLRRSCEAYLKYSSSSCCLVKAYTFAWRDDYVCEGFVKTVEQPLNLA